MLLALHGALVNGVIVFRGHSPQGRNRYTIRLSALIYFSHRLNLLIKSSMPKLLLIEQSLKVLRKFEYVRQ